jgi:hypothetical protein
MAYTTIDNSAEYFNLAIYTGNGGTQSITGIGHQPDFVWIKQRDAAVYHQLANSVTGVTKYLNSNDSRAEQTETTQITSFDSDGFSLGNKTNTNDNNDTYVAWCWKESTTSGFDIVSYAGNGVEGRNISHSLGAKPHWMIVKNRSADVKFAVYHEKNTSAPGTDHLQLNSDAATSDDDSTWDDTEPTSSVFRVKGSSATNGSSADYIAYLWAPIQGFSKFGSYTGNGNADGPMNYLGFKPAFVITKLSSGSGNSWNIFDNKREGYNVDNDPVFADVDGAETTTDYLDFLSNGFKIRRNSSDINTSGATYIYMAFAESPFVNSNGVPNNAR